MQTSCQQFIKLWQVNSQKMNRSNTKRTSADIMRLVMSDFEVSMAENNRLGDFFVKLRGPTGSPFEGGIWKLRVRLPAEYPYKSPSIGFCNTLFHPNVDEASGSVCLDVINQTWSPMFDLVNIFRVFIPQLLLYPNPSDPLNGEAARLMLQDQAAYEARVRVYVRRFASVDFDMDSVDEDDVEESDEGDESEEEEFSDMDDEAE